MASGWEATVAPRTREKPVPLHGIGAFSRGTWSAVRGEMKPVIGRTEGEWAVLMGGIRILSIFV